MAGSVMNVKTGIGTTNNDAATYSAPSSSTVTPVKIEIAESPQPVIDPNTSPAAGVATGDKTPAAATDTTLASADNTAAWEGCSCGCCKPKEESLR